MVERNVLASFTGQLFEAPAATKKWTSISSSNASIQVMNIEDGSHQIIGLDKDQELFAHKIDNDMQLLSKDNFVQWKKNSSAGQPTTYGVRLKDSRDSQRLEGIVGGIMAMLEIIPSPAPWPTDTKPQSNEKPIKPDHLKDILLKVHLPGKQTTVITVPPNITMEKLLSLIMMKRRLDSQYYELVLPPSKPKSMQAQLLPTTPLHTLSINEIHVVKQSKPETKKKHSASSPPDMTKQSSTKQRSMTLPGSQKKISSSSLVETSTPPLNQKRAEQFSSHKQTAIKMLTVHLPYDQRTVIQVSPATTMPQVLVYICEKRNLNPAHHSLLIPSPTSGQVKMATKEMTVSSLRSNAITLVDLKASSSSNLNSVIPDYSISGKKGSFSPTKVKPEAVDSTKKKIAPQVPANESRQMSQNAMHSVETKVVEKSDKFKEQTPVKHIAKRKAPPPPKGVKKDTTVPLSHRESETNLSLGNPAIAHTRAPPPPGSPGKRPAPAIPTASKQPMPEKQISKQTSDSALITHQPPASPLKRLLSNTAKDIIDHPAAVPLISTTKKRWPAPTRPPQRAAPPPPSSPAEHELESSEFQTDDLMDTSVPTHVTAQLQQRAKRPGSATSAQIKLEINELEASLADVIEEAEWHLQQKTSTEPDQPVDETDLSHIPMEINASQLCMQTENKTVSQPQGLAPDQMISESGTVRGIKGRVKEQIASNQSKIMVEGLLTKKQQSFARTPLSVFHKAESLDGAQAAEQRTSLKKYGSQETLSTIENEDAIKRSNSLKSNQTVKQTDRKQKPRGKAPPPPQGRVKAQQPQLIQSKSQSTAALEGHSVNISAENNQILKQNAETVAKQTAPDFILANRTDAAATVDAGKKVPPKVKPKTAKAKSKEAEDHTFNAPESLSGASPIVVSNRSKPHHSLSKRAKSESQIKHIPQTSPRIDKKPNAIIESSDDGQQVLVLSPVGNNNTKKDTSVRIFLPPPPPILPPVQELEDSSKNHIDNKVSPDTTVSTNDSAVVTNNNVSTVEGTVLNSIVASGLTNNNNTLQQQIDISHLPGNNNLEVNSEMEAVKSLPHVVFQSLEDLPPTPPGSPCDELELDETMFELESHDDDGIDMVPPPPPLDNLNVDDIDNIIPPLDDFDPLSLPPPLLVDHNDDVFDILLPPPSVIDNIIVTTTSPPTSIDATIIAPPTLSTADDPITALPHPSLPLEDDIIPVTTEISSQQFEEDETFEDLPVKSLLPAVDNRVTTVPEDDYDNSDEIMLNMFPEDISQSESDSELPTMNDNIVTELENTQVDEDDKIISQFENIITAELESTDSDVSIDEEAKKPEEQEETAETQVQLSNIIASLETMLQDEPRSHEEQIMDDIDTMPPPSAGWVQPFSDQGLTEVPTEVSVDGSKDDAYKADLNQQPSDDINQTMTVAPKLDTETITTKAPASEVDMTNVKLKAVMPTANTETTDIETASFPVRVAPPPPPPPPIGKVRSPPKMVNGSSSNTTSPTKAKSPPPAVKPKPKRPVSGSLPEEFQDELAKKLKKRQQKILDWAKDDDKSKQPPYQTAHTVSTKQPSATQARTVPQNTAPVLPQLQATSAPSKQGEASNTQHTTSPSGSQEQMEQLQLLQNQVLQQQILMLQQQLQQLQQQMPQGQMGGNPMMAMPLAMPQAGIGMQIPQVGTGMQTGIGMQIPQAANLIPAPQLNTRMQVSMQQQNETLNKSAQSLTDRKAFNATRMSKITTGLNTSTDSESTCSESPPPPPATSPPPLDNSTDHNQVVRRNLNKTTSDSAFQHRPSSQLLRSKAFGEYGDLFDDILEEVREVDHNAILKKPPPPPPNQTGGPHMEMASLLAEAMKQRRINITTRLSSVSVEEEPDNSHEWD